MGKLLSVIGRPAISLAALTMGPIPANFETANTIKDIDRCVQEVGHIGICQEVIVEEEPQIVGHSALEDPWVWVVAAGVSTVILAGLGTAFHSLYKHLRNLESDFDPEYYEIWTVRELESEKKARADKAARRAVLAWRDWRS